MPKRAPLTSTTVPPISGTFEYAVRAMLRPQFLIRSLAGLELFDGSRRLDPAPFDTGHRAGWTRPTHKLITRIRAVSGASAALVRRVGLLYA